MIFDVVENQSLFTVSDCRPFCPFWVRSNQYKHDLQSFSRSPLGMLALDVMSCTLSNVFRLDPWASYSRDVGSVPNRALPGEP